MSLRFPKILVHEPLLQFLLLGLLLFGVSQLLDSRREAQARRIVIDPVLVEYQRNLHHVQLGSYPDARALEALIQNHIRDEALYREAVRLGLGNDDAVIRQRLIQKMEFVLTDATAPPEPDAATLQQFEREHAERYAIPGRLSFELLYYATAGHAQPPRERATAALQQLQAGAATAAADRFALGNRFTQVDADELARLFGESEMASAPLDAPLNAWTGPFQSSYGWHLLRVTARAAATSAPAGQIREQLRADWLTEFREADKRKRIAALVAAHEVIRLDQPPAR